MITRRDILTALLHDREVLSLVLITHALDTAASAHRIAALDAGENSSSGGPARRVLAAPRHPFTVSLVETTTRLEAGKGT
ncbi:hypothetical protein ACFYPC_10800 [Streptomyces sp. NPDC005808]|uniref:hypothetical protein n=1 Tax=Streptomyces sp. NPDC005808 TaxID=3364734 RepID=UPI0036CAD52F